MAKTEPTEPLLEHEIKKKIHRGNRLLDNHSFSAGGRRFTYFWFIATLHAMLWRPEGHGPFPGILLNHGSGRTREDLEGLGPYEQNAEKLGLVFARHG